MNPRDAELRRGARFVFWICYVLGALPVGALLLAGTFAFHGSPRGAVYGVVVLAGPLVGYRRILAALLGERRPAAAAIRAFADDPANHKRAVRERGRCPDPCHRPVRSHP